MSAVGGIYTEKKRRRQRQREREREAISGHRYRILLGFGHDRPQPSGRRQVEGTTLDCRKGAALVSYCICTGSYGSFSITCFLCGAAVTSLPQGYDTFCPIGDFIPRDRIPDPSNVDLWLKVDGQYRQRGNTSLMIFKYTISGLVLLHSHAASVHIFPPMHMHLICALHASNRLQDSKFDQLHQLHYDFGRRRPNTYRY